MKKKKLTTKSFPSLGLDLTISRNKVQLLEGQLNKARDHYALLSTAHEVATSKLHKQINTLKAHNERLKFLLKSHSNGVLCRVNDLQALARAESEVVDIELKKMNSEVMLLNPPVDKEAPSTTTTSTPDHKMWTATVTSSPCSSYTYRG